MDAPPLLQIVRCRPKQDGVVIEEAAQSAIYASGIGGAEAIPPEMLRASRDRATDFQAAGTAGARRASP